MMVLKQKGRYHLIFEAVEPIRIVTKTLGSVSLSPGDRLDWPDPAVKMLLAQYPASVRLVHDLPFQVGDQVTYKIPMIERVPHAYIWTEHHGTILAVNDFSEMVLIQPEDESGMPWRWLWWGYAKLEEPTL
ncbi:MAG: hypothetical protein R3B95_19620 [Nitrospirales bacterium]|nr:hypothetical protein [Nitrospirales bacterium]